MSDLRDTAIQAPRANPDLIGHEAAERELRRLFETGRLPHALLICGPRGIGKATLAFRLARFVLTQPSAGIADLLGGAGEGAGEGLWTDPESGVFRRVASGGHADLLTAERAYDKSGRLRNEIVVADSREIGSFLHLTPAEGGWRVVVVDGADAMNRSAQNALLKTLEEPPRQSLLLLVTHNPGLLLPTIRSRCQRFRLSPLPSETVHELVVRFRPELEASQVNAVVALATGSVGTALDFAASGGIELYRAVLGFVRPVRELDFAALHAFADRLSRREAQQSCRIVEGVLVQFLARIAVATASGTVLTADEAEVSRRLRAPASRWAVLHDEIANRFARADGLNLDRKQTILGAFFAIGAAAG